MLNQLRNLTKTWIAAGFIALLVASFAVWGVADIFTSRTPDAVALVGEEQVTIAEFTRDFERELTQLSEQSGGQIDRSTALQLGLDQSVLARLTLRAAMEQKIRALGLASTEAAVARELREIPAFIDPITGRFDRNTYLSLLAQNSMTPARFEADLRLDAALAQLLAALNAGPPPPDVMAAVRARFMGEIRALSVVSIPPDAVGESAEPTLEELEAFYAERADAFAIPPRRAFSFVTLTLEDFIADVPVDEAALMELYEQRRDQLRTPERRDVVELAAPDGDVAAEVARRLRAGEDPEAIAEALELAPPNVYDDAVAADLLTSDLAEAAFAAAEGEVTEPVDGGIAWFVARVDAVTPGVDQTFEDARDELARELASGAAGERLFDAYDAFERARGQGATLEAAAAAAGVPVFSYGLVDSTGAFEDGVRAQQLAALPDILSAAFAAPVAGVVGELEQLGEEGYFALGVDEIAPAAARPLAEVEDQVRAQHAQFKRNEALNALAEAARASLAEGAGASAAAAAAAPSARGEISELRRGQATPAVSRELLARAFGSRVGDVVVGATPDGGRVVARVDAVRPADESPPEELERARASLALEIGGDLSQLFERALRSAYPARVDQTLLAQAAGASTSP